MLDIIKCEYCKYEITVKELFEDERISSISEHWYCCKSCYDKDTDNLLNIFEEDEW
jgi:hypothetical protein